MEEQYLKMIELIKKGQLALLNDPRMCETTHDHALTIAYAFCRYMHSKQVQNDEFPEELRQKILSQFLTR